MKTILQILLLGIGIALQGCQGAFLDAKPQTALLVPKTLDDLERLLNNEGMLDQTPGLGELSTDEYYLTAAYWKSLSPVERNAHVWAEDIYEGTENWHDWNNAYVQIFYSNLALETLQDIPTNETNQQHWNQLRGRALFLRGYAYYQLSQVFVPVYDVSRQEDLSGLPLKQTTQTDEPLIRASLGDTYAQILEDFQRAAGLLPTKHGEKHPHMPTRATAYGALSRVYLSMGKYEEAGRYADSSLRLHATLLDYNTVNISGNSPFASTNPEMLYTSKVNANISSLMTINTNLRVSDALYQLYQTGDIRKQVFFRLVSGYPVLKNGYYGNFYRFTGLTTAEMYLNRAEAAVRQGYIGSAMSDLNQLKKMRFPQVGFQPYDLASAEDALALVLEERRRELCFRGLRWTDLRRLNLAGAGITLSRELDGKIYTLPPNSSRYTFPAPLNAIMNSNITTLERHHD